MRCAEPAPCAQCNSNPKPDPLHRAGALDVEAAKAAGVLPGRSFGELKARRAVQTVGGEWVQPEQVLYPVPPPH